MNYKNMVLDGKDVLPPPPPPPATPLALGRQSSIYSLTFEEFQSAMAPPGKDFGSMNMDELLKNIWSAEESQAMSSAVGGPENGCGGAGDGPGLQRQESLTLPRILSQKTVDQVWRDLAGEQGSGCHGFHQQRQPTLGEMTLEDFLLRAGVVREDFSPSAAKPMVDSSNYNSFNYGELPDSSNNAGLALELLQTSRNNGAIISNQIAPLPLGNAADLASQQGMGGAGIMGIGDLVMSNGLMQGVVGLGGAGVTAAVVGSSANQVSSDGLGKGNMDLSSLSPVPYMFSGGPRGSKRSGTVERVVERRQKRMIKNRESAARSRARKQAYTMELEAEVSKLKEQNEELQKKQEEITEMQKIQVLEVINQQRGPKKRCLRRTHTGPW